MIEIKDYPDLIPEYIKAKMSCSLMQESERIFLDGLIREFKPKKILEIGIAAGSSSLVLLNAAKDIGAKVYSIDYLEQYYADKTLQSGYVVDECPDLKQYWTKYTGAMAAKFMDDIGKDIDFVFLDAAHFNPGELLDYIQILPYLSKKAIVVIHDITHHTDTKNNRTLCFTCSVLFSILKGQKFLPKNYAGKYGANIGAVKLSDDAFDCACDVFNALRLPWKVTIDVDYPYVKEHLQKYYPQVLTQMFEQAYLYNKDLHCNRNCFNDDKLKKGFKTKLKRTLKLISTQKFY